jgi:hypothetical protein
MDAPILVREPMRVSMTRDMDRFTTCQEIAVKLDQMVDKKEDGIFGPVVPAV